MSSALRMLLALIAGLGLGAWIAAAWPVQLDPMLAVAGPVGTLWINALRMTVVPLVFALLVTGISSAAQAGSAGGLAGRTLGWFLVLLAASGLFGMLVVPLLAWLWPAPAGAVEALRGAAAISTESVPPMAPLGEWLVAVVPVNPVAAAANGDLLPLSLFALAFGFALTRLPEATAKPLLDCLRAIADALMQVIGWVLWLGPLGVFALALEVGARGGLAGAGALAHYVLLACTLLCLVIVLCYPLALLGRGSLAAFARAVLPAQVMAASTRSSLACLPAMLTIARGPLRVPPATAALVLPMAVSLFRITNPAMNVGIAMYGAALLGVDVPWHLALAAAAIGTVVSLAAVGLPGQVSFFNTVAPPWLLLGLPLEFLPLLLAVEAIPDVFRTIGNVTGDLTVVHVIAARPG